MNAPKPARSAPPVDIEAPTPRGSLPSLDMSAGPVKLLARGGAAVYGGALAIIGVVAVYHLPGAIGAVNGLARSIDKTSEVLAAIGADVKETRASSARVEAQSARIETALDHVAGEVTQLRADVRAGCAGRRP